MEIQNKKIPVTALTVSFVFILYSILTKDYQPIGKAYMYVRKGIAVPLSYFEVDFLLFKLDYLSAVFILFLVFTISFLLILYSNDVKIIEKKNGIINGITERITVIKNIWIDKKFNKKKLSPDKDIETEIPFKSRHTSKNKKFDNTELFSLGAIVIFSIFSWIFFNDVFLVKKSFESFLGLGIYNKVLADDWDLSFAEKSLFDAEMSYAEWESFYNSEAFPNIFVGLTLVFAFIFFARHIDKNKVNRRISLLIITGSILIITMVNFVFIEFTDSKRTEAINHFKERTQDPVSSLNNYSRE